MANYLATFVTPAYNRQDTIDRCIGSTVNSGMITQKGAYEHIVIDDASKDTTVEHVDKWRQKYPDNVRLLQFKDHLERIYGYNAGMLQARGEWIIWLDSDDELMSHFKKAFEDAIDMYPNAMILNWGSLRHWRDKDKRYVKTDFIRPFQVTIASNGQVEPFKSGGIASGAFAFKKKCLLRTGYLPEAKNPYEFGRKMLGRFPILKKLYTLPDGRIKYDLGNPWGNDPMMYFMLTRYWVPVTLNQYVHNIHVRA